jgi:thioesterase domain-containing protein
MLPDTADDILLPFTSGGEGPTLYCVHAASGSAYTYLPLNALIDHGPVVGIEAPGYDGEELPPADLAGLADMADRYARAIDADRAGQAVCLLGWSMGGVVAFETAERLRTRGCPVALVILIDAQVPGDEAVPEERSLLAHFAAGLVPGSLAEISARIEEILRSWPAEVPAAAAWELLGERGFIPAEFDEPTLRRRFAVYRTNVEALQRHRVVPGHRGPVLAITARDTPAGSARWSDLAADVQEVAVPGDHYSIWLGDGLEQLGRVIRDALRHVRPARAEGAAS